MRTAIFGILFLSFAIGIHAGPAHAKNISNPLYALNKGSVSDSCLNKEEDVSKIGENAPVRRDIIVCTLVKAAPPELDYMLLRKNGGPHGIDPLLNALVPCPVSVGPASPSGHDAADPDSIPALTSDDYVELCKIFYTNLKAANITPEVRFKDKPNLLFIRQSLLALFQSAEYGRRNGFVVLREDWTDATSGLESANYRPLVNPFFDDVALIRYLSGETAFEVVRNNFTSPGGIPLPTYADTRNEQKVIKIGTSDGNELSVWAPIMTGYASPLDYAWSLLGNLDNTIEIKIAEKDQKTVSNLLLSDRKPEKDDTANIQLAIVKAAGDFAKTKPDGAKIGTLLNNNGDGSVIGSDDQQVTADAALGLRFRLIREYENHCSRLVPDTINLTATGAVRLIRTSLRFSRTSRPQAATNSRHSRRAASRRDLNLALLSIFR
ncbi:MAG: hypothetical protein KDA56_12245 [Hyphomonas sp.]|nr:hypothetical protein [Hyphomonas sp.]